MNHVQFILLLVTFATCQLDISLSFKLPPKLKWKKLQLHSEEGVSSDMNSISSAPGKTLKFPDESDFIDYSSQGKKEDKTEYSLFPVAVSFRNGEIDSKYMEDLSTGAIKYEEAKPHLERFYKKPTKSQPTEDQIIVFPNEEANKDSVKALSNDNEENSSEGLRMQLNSREVVLQPSANINVLSNATAYNEAYKQSLESLAQIVRQLLFRIPETESEVVTVEQKQKEDMVPPTSIASVEVSEQSLYGGPKLRPSDDDSSGCPDGWKRNRHGMCQKPGRILTSG